MTARLPRIILILPVLLGLLAGCASLRPSLEPPKVSLQHFRALPSDAGVPKFEIGLRVINTNRQTLDIAGISYTIELQGREVITGVANDVAPIKGYDEGIVTLEAGLQVMEVIRLATALGTSAPGPLSYRFAAKIDFNGFFPTQRIEESGEITLQ